MNRKLLAPFGIIVLILVSLLVSGGTSNASCGGVPCGGFTPRWGPAGTTAVTIVPNTPSANPEITTSLNISQPSKNFAESTTFGDSAIATGAVPLGAFVGSLGSLAQLGLINSGCNNSVPVTFPFVSSSVDQSAGNIISPLGASFAGNLDANLAEDDGDLDNDHQTVIDSQALVGGVTQLTVHGPNLGAPLLTADGVNQRPGFLVGDLVDIGGKTTPDHQKTITGITPNDTTSPTFVITLSTALPTTHLANDTVAKPDTAPVNAVAKGYAYNGIADGSDAYPSFLTTTATGAFPGAAAPQARYMGVAFVASSLIVLLNLVIFPAGGLATLSDTNHQWMTAAWGTPSVAVLNDPVSPPSNSAITDFCNFTSTTDLFGVAHDNSCTPALTTMPAGCTGTGAGYDLRLAFDGGATGAGGAVSTNEANAAACSPSPPEPPGCTTSRATNPSVARTVKWRSYAMSLRDADRDGIDNTLDPCPFNTDTWDPYAAAPASATGDSDGTTGVGDGIPNTCDTVVSGGGDTDQDTDTWNNRGENCPQVANGAFTTTANTQQFDQDIAPTAHVPDGGPHSDGIGAACNSQALNGPPATGAAGNGPYGIYNATVIGQTICIGTPTGTAPPFRAADCSTSTDADGDGIANAFDNCIGDAIGGANAPIAGPPAYAQAQRDVTGDGLSDIADLQTLQGTPFGKIGGVPGSTAGYEGRLDTNNDGVIDIIDVQAVGSAFGRIC